MQFMVSFLYIAALLQCFIVPSTQASPRVSLAEKARSTQVRTSVWATLREETEGTDFLVYIIGALSLTRLYCRLSRRSIAKVILWSPVTSDDSSALFVTSTSLSTKPHHTTLYGMLTTSGLLNASTSSALNLLENMIALSMRDGESIQGSLWRPELELESTPAVKSASGLPSRYIHGTKKQSSVPPSYEQRGMGIADV
ncbi:hypothetical protein BU15DRAFT_61406 [Melanogaster broomeanus]|nr:hypothetical protein BU15DRAFT_61406 [Melanogaster broomeanus]